MNPKRKDDVRVQDLPDGSALLYDTETATAYPITESAAVVWKVCDGEHSLDEIADTLEAHYDASRETISSDLSNLIEDLRSKGLLQSPAAE
jgi:hypothetical protein